MVVGTGELSSINPTVVLIGPDVIQTSSDSLFSIASFKASILLSISSLLYTASLEYTPKLSLTLDLSLSLLNSER